MPSEVKAPHERIEAAVRRMRFLTEDATQGYLVVSTVHGELLARLLEGMAEHWKLRPIADWEVYHSTPLAALVRHINGEEAKE